MLSIDKMKKIPYNEIVKNKNLNQFNKDEEENDDHKKEEDIQVNKRRNNRNE